jgi:hypothetical protein
MNEKTDNVELVPFDVEADFRVRIEPLMDQISDLCNKHGVPFMANLTISRDEQGEEQSVIYAVNGCGQGHVAEAVSKLSFAMRNIDALLSMLTSTVNYTSHIDRLSRDINAREVPNVEH